MRPPPLVFGTVLGRYRTTDDMTRDVADGIGRKIAVQRLYQSAARPLVLPPQRQRCQDAAAEHGRKLAGGPLSASTAARSVVPAVELRRATVGEGQVGQ